IEIDSSTPKPQSRVRFFGNVSKANNASQAINGVVSISPRGQVLTDDSASTANIASSGGMAFELLPRPGQKQWYVSGSHTETPTARESGAGAKPLFTTRLR